MRAPRPDRAVISSRLLVGVLLATALFGCEASSTPGAPPISLAKFSLTEMAPRTGCELVRLDYGSLTFRIRPDAPVEAITANGHGLRTVWEHGFVPDPMGELLIRDAAGEVVVRDGDVLVQPELESPRLNGHVVCASAGGVFVFDGDASDLSS